MDSDSFCLTYNACRESLAQRVSERAPSRIQLLSGPRQVGKTTLVLELAKRLGQRAIYAAADGPEAALPGFWERLWIQAEEIAVAHGQAVVFLDEAHLLPNWSVRLKGEWDRLQRRKLPIHIVATGSSALRLATDSRESLAGRFERLTLTHWSAASLKETFSLSEEEAAAQVVQRGSYPGAYSLQKDLPRWSAYVREAILEPAIGRDLLALASVRKPALLRQVFGMCASSPAQIVSLQKMQGQLQDAGSLEVVAHYLRLLEEAYLVAPLEKYSPRPARRRSAPPKLIVLNNALLAVSDPRGVPDTTSDPLRFGTWVENACLAHAWNSGQKVSYWREEPFEVDGVLEGTWGGWVVEIKTGTLVTSDLRGLLEFQRRYPRFRPLMIGKEEGKIIASRAGIETITWQDFLLRGPGR